MVDTSYLRWPFFERRHEEFAEQVSRVAATAPLTSHDEKDLPDSLTALVRHLGEAGICRHAVTAPYGGFAPTLDVRTLCLIRERCAYHDGLLDFAFAMQGLGSAPLSFFGSEELRQEYLPPVSQGAAIAAFALSEEDAGSDVGALSCRAQREGGEYIIDGTKAWISNAGIASFYTVFARTGEDPTRGISAFVVSASNPGCRMVSRTPITSPHPVGTLEFSGCRVPESHRLGAEGEGFKIAMSTLDVFRPTVGAAALGFARRALDEALRFVNVRMIGDQPLASYQMTQEKIADMALDIDTAALLIYRAAWTKDSGASRITREAAMAKLHATEIAQRVVDKSIQLLGGRGVIANSTLERLYRDVRPLRIYEGTSEIQRIIIANQTLRSERASGEPK